MNHPGTPGRHRAPTLYRPARTNLTAMILLACTTGITAAASEQAHTDGHHHWTGLFAGGAAICALLYLHCARHWVLYPDEGPH